MDRGNLLFRGILFIAGSMSIGSLLLYFFGISSFSRVSITLSTIEVLLLGSLLSWAWRTSWAEAKLLLLGGFYSGLLATLAYDVVRIPIVHAGIPVFKAISYFGTVLVGQDHPTPLSEFLGWSYHLSNGISFALMYGALAVRAGPVTAVLWGLSLEGAMLLTPYAEVFGYQRDARFMAITIGSHAVYGFVLWLGLRYYERIANRSAWIGGATALVPVALGAIAADFNAMYASKIPQSPPAYVGSHLYTVWNVPEPDRVAVIWLTKRYVDQDAVFHFIEPFEKIKFGTPFDVPEASVRRSGTQSATQVVLANTGLKDKKLEALARVTAMTEVSPWMLSTDVSAGLLAERMRKRADSTCGRNLTNGCLPALMQDLDDWYKSGPE